MHTYIHKYIHTYIHTYTFKEKEKYVGQTQNQLRIRRVCHKYDIRHEVDTPAASHFNLPGHYQEENFEIIPIEQPPHTCLQN